MRRTLFLGFLHILFLTVAECLPSCQQPQTGRQKAPCLRLLASYLCIILKYSGHEIQSRFIE